MSDVFNKMHSRAHYKQTVAALKLQEELLAVVNSSRRLNAETIRCALPKESKPTIKQVRYSLDKLVIDGNLKKEKNPTANIMEYWNSYAVDVIRVHRHGRWISEQ